MAAIKDLGDIAKKFQTVTPQRAGEYTEGVEKSTVDWAQATEAAEGSYEAGIQSAVQRKAFGKGVRKAGTQKFKEGVRTKGGQRFAAGVAIAGPAYEQGFAPYHRVIAGLTLPLRHARRDPRNLERVAAVANALGQAKERMSSS